MTDDDSSASNRALCSRLARGPRRQPKPPHEDGGMTVRQMLTGVAAPDVLPAEFIELRDAVRHARRALTDALGAEPSAYIIVDAAREIIRARSPKMPS